MDTASFEQFIGRSQAKQAHEIKVARDRRIRSVLHSKRMPQEGWDWITVETFLNQLSACDSNNAIDNVGVGEREGRVFCENVKRRHFGFVHGIGRSGDISALQPKAHGSSVANALTNSLVLDAIQLAGIHCAAAAVVLPLATGMTLSLCFSSIRESLRQEIGYDYSCKKKYVVWSRIDQKSCFKAILSAGLCPSVVELQLDGDTLRTDVEAIRERIHVLGHENILCVVTTTSTFAPRVPDDVEAVAKLCKEENIHHVVNNAYGLQCTYCCHLIEQVGSCLVDCYVLWSIPGKSARQNRFVCTKHRQKLSNSRW
eukprot:GHVQ01014996.1.p1 GENE.GHVQ01014996.1~~GHVQ01014996.1.p1  ORF type:complete len:313 (-),score=32.31 GHVQ01014996.1:2815-3753(-)